MELCRKATDPPQAMLKGPAVPVQSDSNRADTWSCELKTSQPPRMVKDQVKYDGTRLKGYGILFRGRSENKFIVWFLGSALWVLLCAIAMSWNAPSPRLVEVFLQTEEPAARAARAMWEEFRREDFAHLVIWTAIGLTPPLLVLLAGLLLTKRPAGAASAHVRPMQAQES